MSTDTIIALSTPPGVAALAVIRMSGPESLAIIERLMEGKMECEAGRAVYRTLRHGNKTLDDAVVTVWRAPHSYTGEETVEISCHGNPHIVENIIEACLSLGARSARPGEFTQRAFLNDKLSLTQAEGLLNLLYAPTERALASARAMKEGRLGRALEAVRAELVDMLSHLEASLDFAEEGIEPRVGPEFLERVEKVRETIGRLLRTAPLGRILQEGALTVIVGEPNVGKSSLLNALLREDRAIVAPTPGTTRDWIEAPCNVRGLPLRLVDTAGRRESDDPVEIEGNRRARALLPKAQLLLQVVEAHRPYPAAKIELPENVPGLLVANKSDLGRDGSIPAGAIFLSALTGEGIGELEAGIEAALGANVADETETELTINARQNATLERAAQSLDRAAEGLRGSAGLELVSVELREALGELAEVIGETDNEAILTRLFENFCIGK
ncbi:MAG TPA: tRNA uridine-5-carboxymethylaminomethyl(34) synthesis GTPase MnmE [Candidatus Methylacidiphilales bacterium]|jgi:tRNA modification GTPase|nr:tRNA uridine-5-carboxymethylaminomethyl(34) synthesis GTPase MnmE [Candidatus Methylacidiphilales bacterium]